MASVKVPKGFSLADQLNQMLSAQANTMPTQEALASKFQPIETARSLSNLDMLLYGTPEMSYDSYGYTPAVYQKGNKYSYGPTTDANGLITYPQLPDQTKFGSGGSGGGSMFGSGGMTGTLNALGGIPDFSGPKDALDTMSFIGTGGISGIGKAIGGIGKAIGGLFGGGDKGPKKKLVSPSTRTTTTNKVGAQRGLLAILGETAPILGDINRQEATRQRSSDIYDVGTLGPDALKAVALSDPESAKLLEKLTSQSDRELTLGGQLTQADTRQAQQSIRSRQQGMLAGTGISGAFGEGLGIADYAQQLREKRRASALQTLTARQNFYGDPYQRVLGRSGAGVAPAQDAVQQALGIGGYSALGQMNPQSSYGQDYFNTRYNAQLGANISNAQMTNQLIGAGISAAGSLAGGAMGMI